MVKTFWFKAKTYGWGWTPATWQGWTVTIVYIAAVCGAAAVFVRHRSAAGWVAYFSSIAIATVLLVIVCYKTGEKPAWRWGERKN